MADIPTIRPSDAGRSDLRQPDSPRPGMLAAISALVGEAFTMAYVAPYCPRADRPRITPDDDHDGRDPGW